MNLQDTISSMDVSKKIDKLVASAKAIPKVQWEVDRVFGGQLIVGVDMASAEERTVVALINVHTGNVEKIVSRLSKNLKVHSVSDVKASFDDNCIETTVKFGKQRKMSIKTSLTGKTKLEEIKR